MQPSIVPRLSFGLVVPSTSRDVVVSFAALAAWMRANAKIELSSHAATTYKELAASVRKGTSDLAWLPPVAYAWLAEAVAPVGSVVRAGKTSYAAALIVRPDSELRTLADLAGVRAGWVDPWSAAGYVVPRIELARAGVDPPRAFRSETFFGGHHDAIRALQRDACDVVGTYARAPEPGGAATEGAWTELDADVRVLATFGVIPPDVIATRRNLAPRAYEAAARAFREVSAHAEGRALLRAVVGGDELREGVDPGHDALRFAYEEGIASGLFD